MSTTDLHQRLLDKDATLAVIGLGYVGLPIALAFAKHIKVIGFDIHSGRVEQMKQGIDPSEELDKEAFDGCDISFTARTQRTSRRRSSLWWPCPRPSTRPTNRTLTPLDYRPPKRWADALSAGDYVVYESTVYPGCTEEDCIPVLEARERTHFRP